MFKLENTRGEVLQAILGLLAIHGMLFADDGFGNFIQVDPCLVVVSASLAY